MTDAVETLTKEVERLKGLLGRYAAFVGEEEGTDFLFRADDAFTKITKAEAKEIRTYDPHFETLGEDLRP